PGGNVPPYATGGYFHPCEARPGYVRRSAVHKASMYAVHAQVPIRHGFPSGTTGPLQHSLVSTNLEKRMRKYLFAAAIATIIAAPAFANDVGVHVGPVGAGVTTGEHHDRTVVKPGDRTTVI